MITIERYPGVRFNRDGVPVLTDAQSMRVHLVLLRKPCPVCEAPAGSNCRRKGNGSDMGTSVHMGRLPKGFDSAAAACGHYDNDVLRRLVDELAGDQHDAMEIDKAFGLPGLGALIAEARKELEEVAGS